MLSTGLSGQLSPAIGGITISKQSSRASLKQLKCTFIVLLTSFFTALCTDVESRLNNLFRLSESEPFMYFANQLHVHDNDHVYLVTCIYLVLEKS